MLIWNAATHSRSGIDKGLSKVEVDRRHGQYGANVLAEAEKLPKWCGLIVSLGPRKDDGGDQG